MSDLWSMSSNASLKVILNPLNAALPSTIKELTTKWKWNEKPVLRKLLLDGICVKKPSKRKAKILQPQNFYLEFPKKKGKKKERKLGLNKSAHVED